MQEQIKSEIDTFITSLLETYNASTLSNHLQQILRNTGDSIEDCRLVTLRSALTNPRVLCSEIPENQIADYAGYVRADLTTIQQQLGANTYQPSTNQRAVKVVTSFFQVLTQRVRRLEDPENCPDDPNCSYGTPTPFD